MRWGPSTFAVSSAVSTRLFGALRPALLSVLGHLPDEAPELSIGVGARPIEVHVGGCYAAGKRRRAVTREQALASLADGIRACIHCRPDTELGVL
ncbi:DUF6233 domain-containing protein [Streptomyces sp. NPDC002205]|uniref:DUF6233 domain-containing protein n=1 Tax=Streptomyces sp. NPDC002205 TaxID=3154411 RepID=UPI0033173B56